MRSRTVSPACSFPRATPRFGCAAITWNGNDPLAIDDISALGFRGIQLRASAVARWEARPGELRDLLARRNLSLVALSSGLVQLDPEAEESDRTLHTRNAQFVHDAGGSFLQVVDERPNGRAAEPEDYQRMGRLLTEIGRRVAEVGVTLVYHNHMGNLGQAPDEVARVLDAADASVVRLLLDVAHYKAAGGDPVAAVARHADRIAFLHLKDLQRPAPGRGAASYRFVELGRGEVDIPGVLSALQRTAFSGWAVVELDAVSDPALSARDGAQISRDYLASIGYTI